MFSDFCLKPCILPCYCVSESESEDGSDDEPLIKKLKKPPTDEEIKKTVMNLLADANLEEVTMKQICKKVIFSFIECSD